MPQEVQVTIPTLPLAQTHNLKIVNMEGYTLYHLFRFLKECHLSLLTQVTCFVNKPPHLAILHNLNHLNQGSPNPGDKTNPQGIPNDSGIIVDHSKSSEVEVTNLDPTKASPPVQRSQSGTSDSSDSSLLDGVPSPVRKKFQKMKVKKTGS